MSLTPDVCWTPVGSTVVPVPYMITADLSDSLATSPNTRFNGQPVFLHDQSKVSQVTGDEAGTGGGVKSGTYKGIGEPIQGSSTVRANGKPVVRHGDPCKMNTGNTIGRVIYQGPGDGAPNADGDTNPPVVPETSEEEQAAREKRGLWARLSEDVHTALDMAGFIPGVGIFADLANAGIYAAKGNLGMAILSGVAAAPGIGDGIKAGAMAAKAGKQVAEKAAKEAAEKGTKEAGEKIGKNGVRVTDSGGKKARDSGKRAKHTIGDELMPEMIVEPLQGIGSFPLGGAIEPLINKLGLIELPEESKDATGWIAYTMPGQDIRIYSEDDKIVSVACYEDCWYKGRNLIGSAFQDVVRLLGPATLSDEPNVVEIDDEEQVVYEIENANVQLWVRDGIVVTVICYAEES